MAKLWATFLVILLTIGVGAYLLYPDMRARYLLHSLGTLRVGSSSFDEAQRLAKKLNARPDGICNTSHCSWSADVSNARVPKWWRGQGAFFRVGFETSKSVVTSKGAVFSIGVDPGTFTPSSVGFGVKPRWLVFREGDREIAEPPTSAFWRDDSCEENGMRRRAPTRFEVHMTPRSSLEDWRRYTAFNFRCLWAYQSCKDATVLLPSAPPIPPLS